MKICPKCKNEYRDGFTSCADCGCELVTAEELHALEEQTRLEKQAQKEAEILERVEKAEELRETKEKLKEMTPEERTAYQEERAKEYTPAGVYTNNAEKAAENKSSAYSFLLVGVLGCIFVALSWFGILPFSFGGAGNWFSHGVMLIFFIAFLIVGIVSAKNVGKYNRLASEEKESKSAFEAYLETQFTEEILSGIEAETEEEAYFARMQYMRNKVREDLGEKELDPSFVESILDAYYDKVFMK